MSDPSAEVHPVQTVDRKGGKVSSKVTLAAYEVYSHLFGKQEAMITGRCRGGFGSGELIGYLYARSFPKDEWQQRFDEAMTGMEHI